MKPLLLILSGIFSLSAWSYSIPNHHQLTKLSGELLKACKLNYKLNLQEVIDYSGLEDSDPHEGNIGTRLANWHFYHGHDEKDVWFVKGVIRKTFHTRWKKMEMSFYKANTISDKSRSTGALIHFIQDVTNPSHVVPVYHGPGRKDLYDYYPIQEDSMRKLFQSNCAKVKSLAINESIPGLLHSTAKATLESLKETIQYNQNGIDESMELGNALWSLPSHKSGDFFGDYGVWGNNFGKTEFETEYYKKTQGPRGTETGYKNQFKVNKSEYDSYALKQQMSAVVKGAALILLGNL